MLNLLTDANAASSVFDFSTIDTSMVLPTVIAIMTVVASVKISPMLIKKGYNMVMSAIRKA